MNIALGEHNIQQRSPEANNPPQLSAASFFAFNARFRPTVTEL